jgi:hypothetical protein
MAPVEHAVVLLGEALRQPLRRKQIVAEFQALVWSGLDAGVPQKVRGVLGELAHDLDYFEAAPALRKEDPTYYGHERLEKEIRDGLRRLEDLGVAVAADEGRG